MEYLAHIREDVLTYQMLQEHLEGTAQLASQFANAFGCGELGYCCGKLHDIGKYSEKFQKRIRGYEIRVDHATAGAKLCKEKGGLYSFLAYCICGHHAGLPDTGGGADTANNGSFEGRMKKKIEKYDAFQNEITVPELKTPFTLDFGYENPNFTKGFFIRMLYSCLVDADFLDTEQFMQGGCMNRQPGDKMEILWERFKDSVEEWLNCENTEMVNGRRTEILKSCMEKGRADRGLFRLTVPTGGGKTVASLAFALRHGVEHDLDHIIYVVPYTSIIEQNAKIFSDILGTENVLENHCNVNYESSEELKPMQLASENWDKPVIVTTNVQFFESLFANKSTKCRKLHNIANSVIIFDEAQMLPNEYLKPCVAAIEELVRNYRSSVVLCTATQPTLQRLFSKDMSYQELCPRVEEQFRFFKRTGIVKLENLSEEDLIHKLQQETQCLCICNTKARVRDIYKQLEGDGVHHLSTLMYPVHRKRVLDKIRKSLKDGEKCIVIATSLVEAGVDLDFQTVYRELAGIDSAIQAAGRCNREGKRSLEESHTYIFQFDNREKVPGQEQQIDSSKKVLREYDDVSELSAIQEYFKWLYEIKGEGLDEKKIVNQFRKGIYPFAKVAKEFCLIEQVTKTILIPKEERAKEIALELKIKGATRPLLREAGQYCVDIYENIFNRINGAGMLLPISEDIKEDFFLLRSEEDYSEETGLEIDAEVGKEIWF